MVSVEAKILSHVLPFVIELLGQQDVQARSPKDAFSSGNAICNICFWEKYLLDLRFK